MFDIGAVELLLVALVALVVIGPKDLPIAMRTAGRWIGQLRGMTSHFRMGIDSMIRDAEIDEQEKIWAEKNAAVMRDHPQETGDVETLPEAEPEQSDPQSEGDSAETGKSGDRAGEASS